MRSTIFALVLLIKIAQVTRGNVLNPYRQAQPETCPLTGITATKCLNEFDKSVKDHICKTRFVIQAYILKHPDGGKICGMLRPRGAFFDANQTHFATFIHYSLPTNNDQVCNDLVSKVFQQVFFIADQSAWKFDGNVIKSLTVDNRSILLKVTNSNELKLKSAISDCKNEIEEKIDVLQEQPQIDPTPEATNQIVRDIDLDHNQEGSVLPEPVFEKPGKNTPNSTTTNEPIFEQIVPQYPGNNDFQTIPLNTDPILSYPRTEVNYPQPMLNYLQPIPPPFFLLGLTPEMQIAALWALFSTHVNQLLGVSGNRIPRYGEPNLPHHPTLYNYQTCLISVPLDCPVCYNHLYGQNPPDACQYQNILKIQIVEMTSQDCGVAQIIHSYSYDILPIRFSIAIKNSCCGLLSVGGNLILFAHSSSWIRQNTNVIGISIKNDVLLMKDSYETSQAISNRLNSCYIQQPTQIPHVLHQTYGPNVEQPTAGANTPDSKTDIYVTEHFATLQPISKSHQKDGQTVLSEQEPKQDDCKIQLKTCAICSPETSVTFDYNKICSMDYVAKIEIEKTPDSFSTNDQCGKAKIKTVLILKESEAELPINGTNIQLSYNSDCGLCEPIKNGYEMYVIANQEAWRKEKKLLHLANGVYVLSATDDNKKIITETHANCIPNLI